MNNRTGGIRLVKSPWSDTLCRLVSQAEEYLLLVSPFIRRSGTHRILSQLQRRGVQDIVRVAVLTDLRPESSLNGATDLEALVELAEKLSKFEVTHLPSLHAKVYLADRKIAIITSGNLTDSGVEGNVEYGIELSRESMVREVRRDFEAYSQLGARVSPDEVKALVEEMRELRSLFNKAQHSVRAQARRAFSEKLEATHVRLLRHRTREKSAHAIFSETILFLLAKGALRTIELHPLIQQLHPDMCDDSIDRIIDGEHFGKKWKHSVRNAQQFLKREGQIRFDGQRWHLTP